MKATVLAAALSLALAFTTGAPAWAGCEINQWAIALEPIEAPQTAVETAAETGVETGVETTAETQTPDEPALDAADADPTGDDNTSG